MNFLANIKIKIEAVLNKALDLGAARAPLLVDASLNLTEGTGANQAQVVFHDQRTLAASGSEELDLAGALTDALGRTLTFTAVKALYIKAAAGNTNNVLVGGAAANGFATWAGDPTDVVVIRPGGSLILVAPDATGYAVTTGTGDLLKIANSAGDTGVTYDIVIIGEGAAA
jgi:hypothetical protein